MENRSNRCSGRLSYSSLPTQPHSLYQIVLDTLDTGERHFPERENEEEKEKNEPSGKQLVTSVRNQYVEVTREIENYLLLLLFLLFLKIDLPD